uniref:Uncharacterized protein n=1 Tax=Arundo donax TaxID=35708 RepID=A0A0A9HEI8_ARUDO
MLNIQHVSLPPISAFKHWQTSFLDVPCQRRELRPFNSLVRRCVQDV